MTTKQRRPKSLEDGEQAFRRRYAGKRLAVVGGQPKDEQISRIRERLGLKVVWLPTDPNRSTQMQRSLLSSLQNDPPDFVMMFVRYMSHVTFGMVKTAVRDINKSCRRNRTVAVPLNTFNTEELARRLLRHAPAEEKVT